MFPLAFVLMVAASSPPVAAASDPGVHALYDRLCGVVAASYDTARGGFGTALGAPNESAIELAFRLGRENAGSDWTARALTTVDWTRGLLDTVGGGYLENRRAVELSDGSMTKNTSSNARRLENALDALSASADSHYRDDAERAVGYFERVLVAGRGGFIAGQIGDRNLEPEANGFAIRAWLRYGALDGDSRFRDYAWQSLDRVWEACWDASRGLRRLDDLDQPQPPQLTDQIEMGRALVLAYVLAGRETDRARAVQLGDILLQRFQDSEKGGFRTQAVANKKGEIKRAARVDYENARVARFLCELTAVTGEPRYGEAAARAWRAFEKDLAKPGPEAADWALALCASWDPGFPAHTSWHEFAAENRGTRPPSKRYKHR